MEISVIWPGFFRVAWIMKSMAFGPPVFALRGRFQRSECACTRYHS